MTTTERKVLGVLDGETIYEHDGLADHQTCPECGTRTGNGLAWPPRTPYADRHPEQFEQTAWTGDCPVCGSETGLPASYYARQEG